MGSGASTESQFEGTDPSIINAVQEWGGAVLVKQADDSGPHRCPVCHLKWFGFALQNRSMVCFGPIGPSGKRRCGSVWHVCHKAPDMGYGAGVRVGVSPHACEFCNGGITRHDEAYFNRSKVICEIYGGTPNETLDEA